MTKNKFEQIAKELKIDLEHDIYKSHYNILHQKLLFNQIYEQNMKSQFKLLFDSMEYQFKQLENKL